MQAWIWRSARNVRTCAMCWAMDGTEHKLEERLDDHPNGRCFAVPKTKTWAELGFPGVAEARPRRDTGVESFGRLPEADKLRILGPAKYAALRAKAIKLPDLVGRRYDPRWGWMRYEKSLVEMGLDKAKWIKAYNEMPVAEPLQTVEAARQILAIHTKVGGSTFSLQFGNMAGKQFYSVSIFPEAGEKIYGRTIDPKQLENYIDKHIDIAKQSRVCIGTWYNEEDGYTYLDLSVLVHNEQLALNLSQKYNQIGMYHLGTGTYIATGGTGMTTGSYSPWPERLDELNEDN